MPVLYRGTVGSDRKLVADLYARIRSECPDVLLEYGDYGLKLIGYCVNNDGTIIRSIRTVCQPARPDNGQPEIVANVDELIKFWRSQCPTT